MASAIVQEVSVKRAVRWLVASLTSIAVFALVWAGLHVYTGLDEGVALTIAGVLFAIVLGVGSWWATLPLTPPDPSPRTVIFVTPPLPVAPPTAGQVVVGDIPLEATELQHRPHLIAALRRLRGEGKTALVTAVTGGRGVGKTQLAAEYARIAIAEGWPVVVWVSAVSEEQLAAGLARLADERGVRRPDSDTFQAAQVALQWLRAQPGPALLVYDNAEDPQLLRGWIPAAGNVQTIITAVRAAFGNLAVRVPVDLFTDAEALTYLHRRTGLDDQAGARELATELGWLPLALAQAAATIGIGRVNPSYPTYLQRLRSTPIQRHLNAVTGSEYTLGAAQAQQLSINQLTGADPTGQATTLAEMLAVLSPTGVAVSLAKAALHLGVGDIADDGGEAADQAIARLADRALITVSLDGQALSMHRLTQRVICEDLTTSAKLDLIIALAATTIRTKDDLSEHDAWHRSAEVESRREHVDTLWQHSQDHAITTNPVSKDTLATLISLRVRTAYLINFTFNPARAIAYATTLNADALRVLGPDHPSTLASQSNLAYAYRSAGDLGRAIPLLQQTLTDSLRVLGPDHPNTLTSQSNLAYAYQSAGDLGRAIPLFEQTLTDRLRVLGPDHPNTLTSRNNLAAAYRSAGDLGRAIPLYEQTLTDSLRVLGPDHPNTLTSRNNLAYAYQSAGDLGRATPLYEQTLTDMVRVLGPDHPDTLTSQSNLAGAYQSAGDLGRAIPLFEQTLTDSLRVLGPDHPDTLASRNNLAGAYQSAGDLGRAIPLFEQTLTDSLRVLGPDHPLTHTIRSNLQQVGTVVGPTVAANLNDDHA